MKTMLELKTLELKKFTLVVAALLTAVTGFPQSLQFTQLPPGANQPSARFDGPIAYDPRSRLGRGSW